MRRSKSNPAKYARHYQRISQRRMTNDDDDGDNAEEVARLRSIVAAYNPSAKDEEEEEGGGADGSATRRKANSKKDNEAFSILSPELQSELGGDDEELLLLATKKKKKVKTNNKPPVLLTPEEVKRAKVARKKAERKLQQLAERSEKKKRRTELYQQLQESSISAQELSLLSSSSRLGRGKFRTKREEMQFLLQKERAGLPLTEEEQDVLYDKRRIPDEQEEEEEAAEGRDSAKQTSAVAKSVPDAKDQEATENGKKKKRRRNAKDDAPGDSDPCLSAATACFHSEPKETKSNGIVEELPKAKKTKSTHKAQITVTTSAQKNKKTDDNDDDDNKDDESSDDDKEDGSEGANDVEMQNNDDDDSSEEEEEEEEESEEASSDESIDEDAKDHEEEDVKKGDSVESPVDDKAKKKTTTTTTTTSSSSSSSSSSSTTLNFAAMMMAGLSSLKTRTDEERKVLEEKEAAAKAAAAAKEEAEAQEEEARRQSTKYVPREPTPVASPAVLGVPVQPLVKKNAWRVLELPHRLERQEDLPVSAMEYEIMNAVRNHEVTILCGETGSGKSTQVPQFLYESGITLGNAKCREEDDALLIGVTQPRRVAAISTAKRVSFEMGLSKDPHVISCGGQEGSLVSYQTRYETAGRGRATRIQFMTDGILLQEIKLDLLLRRFAVIVLDEAHERNLNTDVLLGLLSAALPLRRQAAAEGSLPPLKLIIMSATLRVDDFSLLFPQAQVVRVPGRTFPVTVHHSKVTELEKYETVAFQKVCKIHRKLPKGGILVFLTGRDEILRMVRRLRRALQAETLSSLEEEEEEEKSNGEAPTRRMTGDSGPREMDDDELEGDMFGAPLTEEEAAEEDDFDNADKEEDEDDDEIVKVETKGRPDGPDKVIVYPLFSMLSSDDQAKVFAPVPEGHRLIVVSTNIAETSLTIPNISYVVDAGREKCRNFHSATGVTSYDVMWISRAAADQRAGRAGRTGPGHVYRLYSSSLYARHMDAYPMPEVLTRPLHDVVLGMKALNITHVQAFPFPTPPNRRQIQAAVELLSSIGCVDTSDVETEEDGDGKITRVGREVSNLPLGVRYGKMLLSAAQLGVLDYAIVIVAVLSESSPFEHASRQEDDKADEEVKKKDKDDKDDDGEEKLDEIDQEAADQAEEARKREMRKRWFHAGGDLLAALLAAGAYSYAGRGAGGKGGVAACRVFCEENGLNFVVMQRIQKMRRHLARLVHQRLPRGLGDTGVALKTGGILSSMPPPNKVQEKLLKQAIVSGLLDHIARKGLVDSSMVDPRQGRTHRAAYTSCIPSLKEPVYMDSNSALYSRDWRKLPEWVCFDTLVRKPTKDGSTSIAVMKNVTPVDPAWIASLAQETTGLLHLGQAMDHPLPVYDKERDAIMCCVRTTFGCHGWILPSLRVEMRQAVMTDKNSKKSSVLLSDDSYRWFARFLLEGKIWEQEKEASASAWSQYWNDNASIVTRRKPVKKVALLVAALAEAKVDSVRALGRHVATKDPKFLGALLVKEWTRKEHVAEVKRTWCNMMKRQGQLWKKEHEVEADAGKM